jgi:hypothetical protein
MTAKLVTLLAAGVALWGNDTAATLGAGGLVPVKAPGIAMESEELRISLGEIGVRYKFRNTTDRDVEAIVAFPLPPLNGGDVANIPIRLPAGDPLNFVAFRVTVDGKPVQPRVEVRSYFESVEITAELAKLGIPGAVLDPGITAAVNRLAPPDRQKVTESNWVDCKLTRDGRCWPYWQSRIQYYWTQRFPAGRAVEVAHSYRPVVGGGYLTLSGDPAPVLKPYCGDAKTVAQTDAVRKKHSPKSPDQGALWE